MTTESSTLQELYEVALGLEAELARVRARLATLTETEGGLNHELGVVHETIEILRRRRGISDTAIAVTDELRERFHRLSPKEMAIEFARMRGNRLLIREAAPTLAAMGLFKDARNASSNLVTQLGRSIDKEEGVFRRIRRGEYELITGSAEGCKELAVSEFEDRGEVRGTSSGTDDELPEILPDDQPPANEPDQLFRSNLDEVRHDDGQFAQSMYRGGESPNRTRVAV